MNYIDIQHLSGSSAGLEVLSVNSSNTNISSFFDKEIFLNAINKYATYCFTVTVRAEDGSLDELLGEYFYLFFQF